MIGQWEMRNDKSTLNCAKDVAGLSEVRATKATLACAYETTQQLNNTSLRSARRSIARAKTILARDRPLLRANNDGS
jgi:hypothetical protein